MVIKLYLSRVSGSFVIKVEQEYIRRILEMKGINYEEIDVSDPHEAKEKEFMRSKIKLDEVEGVPLPPQLFKDDGYRGDFSGFFHAVETESLYRYLGLEAPKSEVEYIRLHETEGAKISA